MSKIVLDVTRLLNRLYDGLLPTGVDRVGLAYIDRYGSGARAVLSERGFSAVLSEKCSQQTFELLVDGHLPSRRAIRSLIAKALLSQTRTAQPTGSVLLHTSHSGLEYARYFDALKRRNIRTVFMVHDLIPLTHPEYCRPGIDQVHRKRIHCALSRAAGLIANSAATLESLKQEACRNSLPLPPHTVARLAPGITNMKPVDNPLGQPYFVMLGTIEPRKNHWFMLHTWRRLVEQMGEAAPKLVIIGRRGWECENVEDILDRCTVLRGSVIEESECNDERLLAWLQHARALLFPSFVEGYGMPLVEALILQVPVIASDLSVFHEIASDIPDYLDPLDGPGWLSLIRAYSHTDSPERASQIERIAGFREPTWTQHFECVDRLLASLRQP
ncbi:glycosyltransferase family 4 protein [Burkholderia cepacia]|uniref:Glycosyltransferase family 4 protein n=1 Tax=Burkholderia cepacia TaxID=292 RepID=A0A8I1DJW2_BURCE|nr:glycosyltransferase family 1 protein [Burkholderia cepacia]MBA9895721.1 glycosyltransferase family 1 protein [Burkholderia cepacia]MBA9942870.1 glycosyltransferase family 1 protein [Burkholderia cepacia]MBA9979546.1 glycosyltransferase family 1 protein [Burkholderia cepacia]MBA9998440.1 glycosyltransferase family 1 protein [Burkholderia cepacia]MBB0005930.1 glycosyltransferase family 1 protein [Burkholderia cepacia]